MYANDSTEETYIAEAICRSHESAVDTAYKKMERRHVTDYPSRVNSGYGKL